MNQALLYCLAYAREKTDIKLHGALAMSNHLHKVLTDPTGVLPRFMHWAHMLVAKALNALDGQWENLFAPGSYSAVRLGEPQDILDKLAYTFANPVSAGLVRSVQSWPGVCTLGMPLNEPIWIERPRIFFSKKGRMPEKVALILEPPPGFEHLDESEYQALLLEKVEEKQEKARIENAKDGRGYMGRKRCGAGSLARNTTRGGALVIREGDFIPATGHLVPHQSQRVVQSKGPVASESEVSRVLERHRS